MCRKSSWGCCQKAPPVFLRDKKFSHLFSLKIFYLHYYVKDIKLLQFLIVDFLYISFGFTHKAGYCIETWENDFLNRVQYPEGILQHSRYLADDSSNDL